VPVNEGLDWLTLIAGGLIIGVIAAAPLGPVNLICIRRTLSYGQLNGFLAGMGAAMGDAVFAFIAGFGVKWLFDAIENMQLVLQLICATILIAYGWRVFLHATPPEIMRNPDGSIQRGSVGDLAAAVASTFVLTVTNPATLVGFVTFFAAFREVVDYQTSSTATLIFVLAAVGGSVLWWAMVTAIAGTFRKSISTSTLRRMNMASGLVIAATGAVLLGYAIWNRLFP